MLWWPKSRCSDDSCEFNLDQDLHLRTTKFALAMAESGSREPGSALVKDGNSWMRDYGLAPKMKFSPTEKCKAIGQAWRMLSFMLLPNSSRKRVLKHIRALFRNTVQFTMSVEFESLTIETRIHLKSILKDSPHLPCQMLSQLLPNPWAQFPIRSLFYDDDAQDGSFDRSRCRPSIEHSCSSACVLEPRHLSRARVEVLCYADFDVEALQLCLACEACSVLRKDSFFRATAFRLFYSTGNIARLTAELFKMSCHDSYHLLQQIQANYGLAADSLVECLAQILLVRDFVGPSSYCCTLSLISLWCSLHGYHESSVEVVTQEAKKLGLLASTSAHLYLFVDVLFKQYGRKLLVLYLHLYVHALTWDLNNFEYSKQVGCDVAVTEMETHLAAIYTKLASLLSIEEDVSLARECILTAFSLEPTAERFARLQAWSAFGQSVGPPRLYPCAGECHCSEKGLCRQNLPYSTWYATYLPHDILDTSLCNGAIPQQLLQDLCIVVEGPRCKRLSWNLSWEALSEICERYLRLARRANAYGESLESRLRRRTQFERWVFPSVGSSASDDSSKLAVNDRGDDVKVEEAGPLPPMMAVATITETTFQMSKMDCLELEEAVRQLTDTNVASADDAHDVLEYGYRSDALSHVRYVPPSEPIEDLNVPMETDHTSEPVNVNHMSTLESLLDSVAAVPTADFDQSTACCEGIELLANSALQFGSLVGHQRPANITFETTESFLAPPLSPSNNVDYGSVSNSNDYKQQNTTVSPSPPYNGSVSNNNNSNSSRIRGIPMSLSELVQSVLSDDPPLVSPSQSSLDYNMSGSGYQAVQDALSSNVHGDNFGSNATDGLLTTSIGNTTQYCAADQLATANFAVPYTIHPAEVSTSATIAVTMPSSSQFMSQYSAVTSSASQDRSRTILLTLPATSTMMTPQYLTAPPDLLKVRSSRRWNKTLMLEMDGTCTTRVDGWISCMSLYFQRQRLVPAST